MDDQTLGALMLTGILVIMGLLMYIAVKYEEPGSFARAVRTFWRHAYPIWAYGIGGFILLIMVYKDSNILLGSIFGILLITFKEVQGDDNE